jgi:hypothetical protein
MEHTYNEILEIVNRETRAWDTQDVTLLLSIFHPDMVWPWPPSACDHNPVKWEFVLGRFNYSRWKKFYETFFKTHTLIHNNREIKKIMITKEQDGAFAVVDIDTCWKDNNGQLQNWLGRVCKVYVKNDQEWLMTMHTGVLKYESSTNH